MKYLLSSYIRQKGKIFPWGSVRILDESVPDNTRDAYSGLWVFSEKLLPYGKGLHYATIVDQKIIVRRKSTNRKVCILEESEVATAVDVDVVIVASHGYLNDLGPIGMRFSKPLQKKRDFKELYNAECGERPTHFDNSPYVKVSTKYLGQKLVTIDLSAADTPRKGEFKIFTFEGKPIPDFTVVYPLSFKKWGEPLPNFNSSI